LQNIFTNRKNAEIYIRTVGIFINGKISFNSNQALNVGDVIQMHRNLYFYSYSIRFFKKLRRYVRRVKARVFKLMRHKIDPNKQATTNIPR
jgi:hypothetical protein